MSIQTAVPLILAECPDLATLFEGRLYHQAPPTGKVANAKRPYLVYDRAESQRVTHNGGDTGRRKVVYNLTMVHTSAGPLWDFEKVLSRNWKDRGIVGYHGEVAGVNVQWTWLEDSDPDSYEVPQQYQEKGDKVVVIPLHIYYRELS